MNKKYIFDSCLYSSDGSILLKYKKQLDDDSLNYSTIRTISFYPNMIQLKTGVVFKNW